MPIAYPNFSRYTPLVSLVMWSLYLTAIWEITTPAGIGFTFLAIIVGIRYYFWRSTKEDEWSYVLYNVSYFSFNPSPLLNGLFLDLVSNGLCDARLLAHVQRERRTMTEYLLIFHLKSISLMYAGRKPPRFNDSWMYYYPLTIHGCNESSCI